MTVTVFWDVDGTLIHNDRTGQDLYRDAVRDSLNVRAEIPAISRHGKTDLQIIQEYVIAVGAPPSSAPTVARRLAQLSRDAYGVPGARIALPGVPEALRAVLEAGHTNSFVTGNSEERTRLKITSAGLTPSDFDWSAAGFGGATAVRTEVAREAGSKALASGTTPLIVGDTPSDGEAARAAGIAFCGVATGVYGHELLLAVDHVLVINNLADELSVFMQALEALA